MPKIIPIILWIAALIGLTIFLFRPAKVDRFIVNPEISAEPPGAVLVDIPWKHLPDVPQFQLIAQNGAPFDSQKLAGKPYLVSFFFATCPGICRDLNSQIARLNEQLRKDDVMFVSLTVDAENDTPEVLNRYAQDYGAQLDRWVFLTDQQYKISQLGEQVFQVVVDRATHTDNILLVDKWGRYRDRFKWDDPYDMKRLIEVVKDAAVELEPPLDKTVRTRNVLAGRPPLDLKEIKWVREFHLTDSHEQTFFSRDLTGEVWIANFFFTSCPTVCQQQNAYLRGLRERLGNKLPAIVSISTDPTHDSPAVLQNYAEKLGADARWSFCTGDDLLIRRISSEFFQAPSSPEHHSSRLFVVDRWHRVRGSFDWQQPADEVAMLKLIESLKLETQPMLADQKFSTEQATPAAESASE